jgi:hypothetical protein
VVISHAPTTVFEDPRESSVVAARLSRSGRPVVEYVDYNPRTSESPMDRPKAYAALFLALLVGCSACSPTVRDVVFDDGTIRLEVEHVTTTTMLDDMTHYEITLQVGATSHDIAAGDVENFDLPVVTRLPDGNVGWHMVNSVCSVISGKVICSDFCRDFRNPNASLTHLYHWVVGERSARMSMRISSAYALVRLGDPDARSAVDTLASIWGNDVLLDALMIRLSRDPHSIEALRAELATASHAKRLTIARACVPELASSLRAIETPTRPQWRRALLAEVAECDHWPAPQR